MWKIYQKIFEVKNMFNLSNNGFVGFTIQK